jgi:putative chromate ion transporter
MASQIYPNMSCTESNANDNYQSLQFHEENAIVPVDLEQRVEATNTISQLPTTNRWIHILEMMGFNSQLSHNLDDLKNVPKLSYYEIFSLFVWFGIRAVGGPLPQLAMMKKELVEERQWISAERFGKVVSVYQTLPGPEVVEIACYFGYITGGKIGAICAGIGFLLPGFVAMLFISWLYVTYAESSNLIQNSLLTIEPCVSAMIFRTSFRLGEQVLLDTQRNFIWDRVFIFVFCFFSSVIHFNFFIVLFISGTFTTMLSYNNTNNNTTSNHHNNQDHRYYYSSRRILSYLFVILALTSFIIYCSINRAPNVNFGDLGDTTELVGTSLPSLFILGLIAGMVTWGATFTSLPFIYSAAVVIGGWLQPRQFLDAIAIINVLPTPLITFVVLVGFIGNHFWGAIMISIGIFLPAFIFPIMGHTILQSFVTNKLVEPFLQGISVAASGLLLFTGFVSAKNVLATHIDVFVFFLAFSSLFHVNNKYTAPLVLVIAAIAGQIIY